MLVLLKRLDPFVLGLRLFVGASSLCVFWLFIFLLWDSEIHPEPGEILQAKLYFLVHSTHVQVSMPFRQLHSDFRGVGVCVCMNKLCVCG